MTFFHLLNCVALTFVPGFIVHRALLEGSGIGPYLYTIAAYLFAQFLKLVVEGIFGGSGDVTTFSLIAELVRMVICMFFNSLIFLFFQRLLISLQSGIFFDDIILQMLLLVGLQQNLS